MVTQQSIITIYYCFSPITDSYPSFNHYIALLFSVQPSTPIFQPIPDNFIQATKDVPLNLTCFSSGGYPRQTVTWYKYWSGQNPVNLTQCTTNETINQGMYDVTERCTFTPTQTDDNAMLYCESSYTGTPPYLVKSKDVQLKLLCKLLR